MDSGCDVPCKIGGYKFAASLRDLERPPQEGLGGSCAKSNNHVWLDGSDFCIQPGTAGGDLHSVRLLVNAALSARLPVECFTALVT